MATALIIVPAAAVAGQPGLLRQGTGGLLAWQTPVWHVAPKAYGLHGAEPGAHTAPSHSAVG